MQIYLKNFRRPDQLKNVHNPLFPFSLFYFYFILKKYINKKKKRVKFKQISEDYKRIHSLITTETSF